MTPHGVGVFSSHGVSIRLRHALAFGISVIAIVGHDWLSRRLVRYATALLTVTMVSAPVRKGRCRMKFAMRRIRRRFDRFVVENSGEKPLSFLADIAHRVAKAIWRQIGEVCFEFEDARFCMLLGLYVALEEPEYLNENKTYNSWFDQDIQRSGNLGRGCRESDGSEATRFRPQTRSQKHITRLMMRWLD